MELITDMLANASGLVLLILIVRFVIYILVVLWIGDIAKSTKYTCNNLCEMEKKRQEQHEEIMIELKEINKTLHNIQDMYYHSHNNQRMYYNPHSNQHVEQNSQQLHNNSNKIEE